MSKIKEPEHKKGDRVVHIIISKSDIIIENCVIEKKLKKGYRIVNWGGLWSKKQLYSPSEAIKFLTNYINEQE
jgi:hypothetical protein